MHSDNFDLSAYFRRIHYTGPAAADTATLHALMRHQLFAIPFENLDVQAGKVVSLIPEEITDKLLYQHRGGYCYELNGLFAMALQASGIRYRFVAARPMFYPARRPKTHMALVAETEGRQWLCDLGFGSYGIRAPLALDMTGCEIPQDFDTFRLTKDEEGVYLLQAKAEGVWANQYSFDLSPTEWVDFLPANYLNSTHPETIFVQKRLIMLHNATQRLILLGNTLKKITAEGSEKQQIDEQDIVAVMKNHFALSTG